MRIRTIKPAYWQHRMHKRISQTAALLGVALLNMADDEGRFEAEPGLIKSLLFTYRVIDADEIDAALAELAQPGIEFIRMYMADLDGIQARMGVVANFNRHQVINRPARSNLPPPPRAKKAPVSDPSESRNDHGAAPDSFTDDSRNGVQSRNGEFTSDSSLEGRKEGREGKEGNREAEAGENPNPLEAELNVAPGSAKIPTEEEVKQWSAMSAFPLAEVLTAYEELKLDGWGDRNGCMIGNWRSYLRKVLNGRRQTRQTPFESLDLQRKLTALEDYEKRHPANESSRSYTGDPSEAEMEDLEKTQAEIKKLRAKAAGREAGNEK